VARRSQKKKDDGERAERILAAADHLFGELGFDAVSVRDVAEHADVNKALVFYYFKSKEELFARVMDGYYQSHAKVLRDAYESAAGTEAERLHHLVDAYVDFIEANRNFPRLVQQQVASRGPALELIGRNLVGMQGWVAEALGDLVPDDGPLAARHFFLTFSASVINHFTYAEALETAWGFDPGSPEGVAERREHLHWLVDALLAALHRAPK
jgi:AcrR family transcriptional regulator